MLRILPNQVRERYFDHPSSAIQDFRQHMTTGIHYHNQKQFSDAITEFQAATLISQLLIEKEPLVGYRCYLKLKIAVAHNLSASYAALGQLHHAEDILRELHESLLCICQSHDVSRHLRTEALGALDNSLFALTNVLSIQGKLCDLFAIIEATDRQANVAVQELLH